MYLSSFLKNVRGLHNDVGPSHEPALEAMYRFFERIRVTDERGLHANRPADSVIMELTMPKDKRDGFVPRKAATLSEIRWHLQSEADVDSALNYILALYQLRIPTYMHAIPKSLRKLSMTFELFLP